VIQYDPFINAEYIANMLKYDSVHGRLKGTATARANQLVLNSSRVLDLIMHMAAVDGDSATVGKSAISREAVKV
jgi:glyceraldehyde-3-phosphate dehydrogenase/erythrose-4-phosphate dehydrogenase